jgi:hypothetical protein
MRSRPLVDEALILSCAYQSLRFVLKMFPAMLRSIGGTPNYGTRHSLTEEGGNSRDSPR